MAGRNQLAEEISDHGTTVLVSTWNNGYYIGTDGRNTRRDDDLITDEKGTKTWIQNGKYAFAITGTNVKLMAERHAKAYLETSGSHSVEEMAKYVVNECDTQLKAFKHQPKGGYSYSLALCGYENRTVDIRHTGEKGKELIYLSGDKNAFFAMGSGHKEVNEHFNTLAAEDKLLSVKEIIKMLQICVTFACFKDSYSGGYIDIVYHLNYNADIINPPRIHIFNCVADNFRHFERHLEFSRCIILNSTGLAYTQICEDKIDEHMPSILRGFNEVYVIGIHRRLNKVVRAVFFDSTEERDKVIPIFNVKKQVLFLKNHKVCKEDVYRYLKFSFQMPTREVFHSLAAEFVDSWEV